MRGADWRYGLSLLLDGLRIETFAGTAAEAVALLLPLCEAVFPGFEPDYLAGRLPHVADPHLLLARRPDGFPLGFKLGYRRGDSLFYSWLGGVAPEARRYGAGRADDGSPA